MWWGSFASLRILGINVSQLQFWGTWSQGSGCQDCGSHLPGSQVPEYGFAGSRVSRSWVAGPDFRLCHTINIFNTINFWNYFCKGKTWMIINVIYSRSGWLDKKEPDLSIYLYHYAYINSSKSNIATIFHIIFW